MFGRRQSDYIETQLFARSHEVPAGVMGLAGL